jgi:adenylosuccinate synthase
LFDETGDKLREIGHEYGAVTGRNRRCGWLDMVALKYAIMVNGVTQLIMMKADVLDTFPTIRVCVAYEKDGVTLDHMPYDTEGWNAVYKDFPGWQTDLTKMTSPAEFPAELNDYIKFIEQETGVPVTIVSVGPDRAQTINMEK